VLSYLRTYMGFQSVFLVFVISLGLAILFLRSSDLGFERVNQFSLGTSNLLNVQFPLLLYRVFCGLTTWSTIFFLLFDRVGLKIDVLTRGVVHTLHLKHATRFSVFTVWSWVLQGLYFLLACLCTLSVPSKHNTVLLFTLPKPLLILTQILFEVSFAIAYLVTVVVTFVLIPGTRSRNMPTDNFFQFLPVLFHNANVLFMLGEVLLNNVTIEVNHLPFVVLYGSCYVVFSWFWFHYKGVFYYFFMDYDAPHAWLWFICLLIAVAIFYFIGYFISIATKMNNVLARVGVVLFSFSILCVRDTHKKNKN